MTSINTAYNYQGRILVPVQPKQEENKPFAISMSSPGTVYKDVTPAQSTQPASTAADGKDDGSIGFWAATGNLLKGVGNFFKGMFCDENGDFSIGQTLKTALMAGAVAAATFIPVVGPLVVPTLCAIGMAHGGSKVISGLGTAMSAKTDAEAEQAWQDIGSGATEGAISYYGYKASGGFKQGWEAAKADWAALNTKPTAPTGGTPASGEPVDLVEGVDYVEVTEEAANTAAKPSQAQLEAKPETPQLEAKPSQAQLEAKPETPQIEAKPEAQVSKAEQTLNKAKAKEPQVRQKNPLAEEARRNIINEQAAKVDAGQSTRPTNAEIAEQGKNLNTESLNGNQRAIVEDAYRDIPTAEQQAAYDKSIEYKSASKSDVRAAKQQGVKFVEQEGPNATQSMQDVKGADALKSVKTEPAATRPISDGTYVDGTNTYTVKNGKIVEYQVKGQDAVTNLDRIARQTAKRNVLERIQSGEIKSASPAPAAEPVNPQIAKWNKRYGHLYPKTTAQAPVAEAPAPAVTAEAPNPQIAKWNNKYSFLSRKTA